MNQSFNLGKNDFLFHKIVMYRLCAEKVGKASEVKKIKVNDQSPELN